MKVHRGFTLVEGIIATLLLVIVSVLVYQLVVQPTRGSDSKLNESIVFSASRRILSVLHEKMRSATTILTPGKKQPKAIWFLLEDREGNVFQYSFDSAGNLKAANLNGDALPSVLVRQTVTNIKLNHVNFINTKDNLLEAYFRFAMTNSSQKESVELFDYFTIHQ